MLTIAEALRVSMWRRPDKPALIFGDESRTYRELDQRANQVAGALAASGVKPGDRVAFLLPNGLTMAEAYFGAARAGAVAVPLNLRWAPDEIRYALEDATPTLVVAGAEFQDLLPRAPHIVVGDAWDARVAEAAATDPLVAVEDTDPWAIIYTSGTTGRPKGAMRDHRSNLLIAYLLVTELGLSPSDVGMALLPMFHVNSIWFVTLSVAIGTTCVIYPHRVFHPAHVVDELNRRQVTYSMFVPTMLSFLADAAERGALDPQHLRVALTSSAPLDAGLRDRLLALFPRAALYDIYGATEYGAVTSFRHEAGGVLGTVGWPLTGQSMRILDDAGDPVPPGAVGEVYFKGPTLMTGYWHNPDATRESFRDGYLTLGDMGRVDEAGRLVLTDRKQDMIIAAGENVYPSEVEAVLMAHPAVQLAAVVGLPDARRGERVAAVVVWRSGATATLDELSAWCRERLADYKRPYVIQAWDALPLGPTGKVVRRLVREQWGAASAPAGG